MTGSTSIIPQVLGASTVAGVATTTLAKAGPSIFSVVLIGVIIVAAAVVVSRGVKIIANR